MGPPKLFTCQALFVNNLNKFTIDKPLFLCYIITMETIMISPTNKASQRTKNRIRENGPVFSIDLKEETQWLLRAGVSFNGIVWMGWLPRNEFHVECVGKKFIEKVLG